MHFILRAASPPSWLATYTSTTPTPAPFTITILTTFLAVLIPVAYFSYRRIMSTMQDLNAQPFPFMEMPPELRDMVYEYLVEDPYYPPPAPPSPTSPLLNWMMPTLQWPSKNPTPAKPTPGSWIFLANKQIYAEYCELNCKRSTFHLSVTPKNYGKPVFKATSSASTAPTSSVTSFPGPSTPNLWTIAPSTLKQIRKCDIKLVITSSMLGVPDPRNMVPDSWALAHQVRAELKDVTKVQELNLHVKAIGDPLWNPLWVWFHATQSFKNMGCEKTPSALPLLSPTFAPTTHPSAHHHEHDREHGTRSKSCTRSRSSSLELSEPTGPKLNRITFSLDTWSPGENYLERDPESDGQWAWFCTKGHCIGPDGGADMPVREFCAKLYMECRTCRPELESDSEDEDF